VSTERSSLSDTSDVENVGDWRWIEAAVDHAQDRFELWHDDSEGPVAIIGPPVNHVFPVQFVRHEQARDPARAKVLDDVRRELDFYLVELGEPDPWAYAGYHCRTFSNAYSRVHWSWHPAGSNASENP